MSEDAKRKIRLFANFRVFRVVLIVALIVFTLLTFLPCVEVVHHSSYKDMLKLLSATPDQTKTISGERPQNETENYCSDFCCVLSVIEILLLCFGEKPRRCFEGFFLHILCTFGPLALNSMNSMVESLIVYAYFDYGATISYRINPLGYFVIGVGTVIAVMYIVLFVLLLIKQRAEKRNKISKPVL